MRSQSVLPDRSADEISRSITNPSYDQREQQEQWPIGFQTVNPDCKRQWKGDNDKTAGADPRSRECFNQRPLGEQRDGSNPQDKQNKCISNCWQDQGKLISFTMDDQATAQLVDMRH